VPLDSVRLDDPALVYGVRMLGEKIAVDLALGSPVGGDQFLFPGVPLLGFAFKF